MAQGDGRRARDLALRAAGLILATFGALSLRYFLHLIHIPPRHETSFAELGLAGVGFVGLSAGCSLMILGARLFDQVEVAARWARCAPPARQADVPPKDLPSQPDRPAFGPGHVAGWTKPLFSRGKPNFD